jgi:hypothetical protein
LGSLFEPGRNIDRITCDEGAALAWPTDDHFSSIDADAKREPFAEQFAQPPLHRKRRVQRPLRVVLASRRRAKHGHDCVADELFHGAATERDLGRHRIVEAVEEVARVLGVERAAELR